MIETSQFAAFIITYNRPEILSETVSVILNQSFPPNVILIIDNSENKETEKKINDLGNDKIIYLRVGFNSGPAGGSKIGLEKLSSEGYNWIYWGDDNNPPRDIYVFEEMFKCVETLQKKNEPIGLIGGKGAKINKFTGRLKSLNNSQLKAGDILEVDYIPGGQTLIVNSEVIRRKVLPNSRLFFSFEDLDFCLKVKSINYKIFIDAGTWLRVRKSYNDISNNYRPKGHSFGNKNISWGRKYYSSRNILKIYYSHKLYLPFLMQLIKTILKIPSGFLYGWSYGIKNAKINTRAIISFFLNDQRNFYKIN